MEASLLRLEVAVRFERRLNPDEVEQAIKQQYPTIQHLFPWSSMLKSSSL